MQAPDVILSSASKAGVGGGLPLSPTTATAAGVGADSLSADPFEDAVVVKKLHGATLPALLRLLTSPSNDRFMVWSFLLCREKRVEARDILAFLFVRFFLDSKQLKAFVFHMMDVLENGPPPAPAPESATDADNNGDDDNNDDDHHTLQPGGLRKFDLAKSLGALISRDDNARHVIGGQLQESLKAAAYGQIRVKDLKAVGKEVGASAGARMDPQPARDVLQRQRLQHRPPPLQPPQQQQGLQSFPPKSVLTPQAPPSPPQHLGSPLAGSPNGRGRTASGAGIVPPPVRHSSSASTLIARVRPAVSSGRFTPPRSRSPPPSNYGRKMPLSPPDTPTPPTPPPTLQHNNENSGSEAVTPVCEEFIDLEDCSPRTKAQLTLWRLLALIDKRELFTIRMGVLEFLETWIALCPADFALDMLAHPDESSEDEPWRNPAAARVQADALLNAGLPPGLQRTSSADASRAGLLQFHRRPSSAGTMSPPSASSPLQQQQQQQQHHWRSDRTVNSAQSNSAAAPTFSRPPSLPSDTSSQSRASPRARPTRGGGFSTARTGMKTAIASSMRSMRSLLHKSGPTQGNGRRLPSLRADELGLDRPSLLTDLVYFVCQAQESGFLEELGMPSAPEDMTAYRAPAACQLSETFPNIYKLIIAIRTVQFDPQLDLNSLGIPASSASSFGSGASPPSLSIAPGLLQRAESDGPRGGPSVPRSFSPRAGQSSQHHPSGIVARAARLSQQHQLSDESVPPGRRSNGRDMGASASVVGSGGDRTGNRHAHPAPRNKSSVRFARDNVESVASTRSEANAHNNTHGNWRWRKRVSIAGAFTGGADKAHTRSLSGAADGRRLRAGRIMLLASEETTMRHVYEAYAPMAVLLRSAEEATRTQLKLERAVQMSMHPLQQQPLSASTAESGAESVETRSAAVSTHSAMTTGRITGGAGASITSSAAGDGKVLSWHDLRRGARAAEATLPRRLFDMPIDKWLARQRQLHTAKVADGVAKALAIATGSRQGSRAPSTRMSALSSAQDRAMASAATTATVATMHTSASERAPMSRKPSATTTAYLATTSSVTGAVGTGAPEVPPPSQSPRSWHLEQMTRLVSQSSGSDLNSAAASPGAPPRKQVLPQDQFCDPERTNVQNGAAPHDDTDLRRESGARLSESDHASSEGGDDAGDTSKPLSPIGASECGVLQTPAFSLGGAGGADAGGAAGTDSVRAHASGNGGDGERAETSHREQTLAAPDDALRGDSASSLGHRQQVSSVGDALDARLATVLDASALDDRDELFGTSSTGPNEQEVEAFQPGSALLLVPPAVFATGFTLRMHYLYCTIPLHEWVNGFRGGFGPKLNSREADRGGTPMLGRFREESRRAHCRLMSMILAPTDDNTRRDIVEHLVRVAECLAVLRSYHCLVLVVMALNVQAIHRLRKLWASVSDATRVKWAALQQYTGTGGKLVVSRVVRLLNSAEADLQRSSMRVSYFYLVRARRQQEHEQRELDGHTAAAQAVAGQRWWNQLIRALRPGMGDEGHPSVSAAVEEHHRASRKDRQTTANRRISARGKLPAHGELQHSTSVPVPPTSSGKSTLDADPGMQHRHIESDGGERSGGNQKLRGRGFASIRLPNFGRGGGGGRRGGGAGADSPSNDSDRQMVPDVERSVSDEPRPQAVRRILSLERDGSQRTDIKSLWTMSAVQAEADEMVQAEASRPSSADGGRRSVRPKHTRSKSSMSAVHRRTRSASGALTTGSGSYSLVHNGDALENSDDSVSASDTADEEDSVLSSSASNTALGTEGSVRSPVRSPRSVGDRAHQTTVGTDSGSGAPTRRPNGHSQQHNHKHKHSGVGRSSNNSADGTSDERKSKTAKHGKRVRFFSRWRTSLASNEGNRQSVTVSESEIVWHEADPALAMQTEELLQHAQKKQLQDEPQKGTADRGTTGLFGVDNPSADLAASSTAAATSHSEDGKVGGEDEEDEAENDDDDDGTAVKAVSGGSERASNSRPLGKSPSAFDSDRGALGSLMDAAGDLGDIFMAKVDQKAAEASADDLSNNSLATHTRAYPTAAMILQRTHLAQHQQQQQQPKAISRPANRAGDAELERHESKADATPLLQFDPQDASLATRATATPTTARTSKLAVRSTARLPSITASDDSGDSGAPSHTLSGSTASTVSVASSSSSSAACGSGSGGIRSTLPGWLRRSSASSPGSSRSSEPQQTSEANSPPAEKSAGAKQKTGEANVSTASSECDPEQAASGTASPEPSKATRGSELHQHKDPSASAKRQAVLEAMERARRKQRMSLAHSNSAVANRYLEQIRTSLSASNSPARSSGEDSTRSLDGRSTEVRQLNSESQGALPVAQSAHTDSGEVAGTALAPDAAPRTEPTQMRTTATGTQATQHPQPPQIPPQQKEEQKESESAPPSTSVAAAKNDDIGVVEQEVGKQAVSETSAKPPTALSQSTGGSSTECADSATTCALSPPLVVPQPRNSHVKESMTPDEVVAMYTHCSPDMLCNEPRVAEHPCMPYVQGFISQLVRLGDIPPVLRQRAGTGSANVWVPSPGVLEDDPLMPVLNVNRIKSAGGLLAALRTCQLQPFHNTLDSEQNALVQALLQTEPVYTEEDEQWKRSLELEPTS